MTYTEEPLIEQPAIKLFDDLDWETLNCWEETFTADREFENNQGQTTSNEPCFPE